ncbi:MAG: hypothetical protein PHU80_11355 [Kiritimatiellae bacterium]|nr:hypothetical protein [Kiritimatiellia bacterium]
MSAPRRRRTTASRSCYTTRHPQPASFTFDEYLDFYPQLHTLIADGLFKRSCLPDGPKVGSVNLSPRGDWRMPSDLCSETL